MEDLRRFNDDHIEQYIESVTQRDKAFRPDGKTGHYKCPLCGSGNGPKGTGAFSLDRSTHKWKCFSCGQGGDIFDLYEKLNNVNRSEATKALLRMYGTKTGASPSAPPTISHEEEYKAQISNNSNGIDLEKRQADLKAWAEALPGSAGEAYLLGRGITKEAMQACGIGFNAWKKSIIIPLDPGGPHYVEAFIDQKTHDHRYQNSAGCTGLMFQGDLISGELVFIVESALCAISLRQAGAHALPLNGLNYGRLISQMKKQYNTPGLILCLDNDEAGGTAQQKLAEELEKAFPNLRIFDGCEMLLKENEVKDPNELLQKIGAEAFREKANEVLASAQAVIDSEKAEQEEERAERTGGAMVDEFLTRIQTERFKPIPTGWKELDESIGGGLIRQQLVLLGAPPGLGKSALAQQIFETMARNGYASVLYLNLEMARDQMMARSIVRIADEEGYKIKSSNRVLQGYSWTDEERETVYASAKIFREKVASRLTYNPEDVTPDLDTILKYIEAEAQRKEASGEMAPIVIIDYLQLISGREREDSATVIKRAVAELKKYVITHNTIVFCIIAHNRQSNKSGEASMESGRDTSALEYSADLQLALTYSLCTASGARRYEQTTGKVIAKKNPEYLSHIERRFITLKVTKGRFGGQGTEIDLVFKGEAMRYLDASSEEARMYINNLNFELAKYGAKPAQVGEFTVIDDQEAGEVFEII